MSIQLFFLAYAAVFTAEIVGDKLLYTTGVLATRYRTVPMMSGIVLAFMAKMAVAVAIGQAISTLPPLLIATITLANATWIAWLLWPQHVTRNEAEPHHSTSEATVVSFASVFFTEWGDIGQVTAATLAAQMDAPVVVWFAAVAAMMTKAGVAATIGVEIRAWLARSASHRVLVYGGVMLMLVVGIVSAVETLNGGR